MLATLFVSCRNRLANDLILLVFVFVYIALAILDTVESMRVRQAMRALMGSICCVLLFWQHPSPFTVLA